MLLPLKNRSAAVLLLLWAVWFTAPPCVQAQNEPAVSTLTDLLRSRSVSGDGTWSLTVASPVTIRLNGTEKPPSHGAIRFSDRGVWALTGGTLDLAEVEVEAPQDRKIFAGPGHVTGLALSRPEWFADAVDGVYPDGALRAAFDAVAPGGTILLREASYISPFFDPRDANPCGGRAVKIGPSLTLVGAKRPEPNSGTMPTHLVNGTILRGGICAAAVLHASHLGVDVGDDVIARDFGGAKAFGIQLGDGGKLGTLAGTMLDDVSVLAMGFQDQHTVIIDGQRDAHVRGLWIWTRGGDHGLVMKSLASTVEDFHCKGASRDCLILKSDYVTDREGDASGSTVDGVFIDYLKVPGDTGGIMLEGRWDDLSHVELRNIHEDGLNLGIAGIDFAAYRLSDVRIQNWTATGMTGPCLVLNSSRRFSVDGFRCSVSRMEGGWTFMLSGRETMLRNGTVECVDRERCGRAGDDVIADVGRSDRIEAVKGIGFGGYLVRTSPHRGGTALEGVDASAMGGRAASVYVEPTLPFGERAAVWRTTTKLYLRMYWTRFENSTGSSGMGSKAWLAGIAFFLLLLLVVLRRRSRRVPSRP
jgi:hypothetical protein